MLRWTARSVKLSAMHPVWLGAIHKEMRNGSHTTTKKVWEVCKAFKEYTHPLTKLQVGLWALHMRDIWFCYFLRMLSKCSCKNPNCLRIQRTTSPGMQALKDTGWTQLEVACRAVCRLVLLCLEEVILLTQPSMQSRLIVKTAEHIRNKLLSLRREKFWLISKS